MLPFTQVCYISSLERLTAFESNISSTSLYIITYNRSLFFLHSTTHSGTAFLVSKKKRKRYNSGIAAGSQLVLWHYSIFPNRMSVTAGKFAISFSLVFSSLFAPPQSSLTPSPLSVIFQQSLPHTHKQTHTQWEVKFTCSATLKLIQGQQREYVSFNLCPPSTVCGHHECNLLVSARVLPYD